jgi:hypothetical protein
MILYVAKKYLVILIFLVFLLTLVPVVWARMDLHSILPSAVFWGGPAAAILVDLQFRRKEIWPLYDNLGFSRYKILGSLIAACLLLFGGLKLWL